MSVEYSQSANKVEVELVLFYTRTLVINISVITVLQDPSVITSFFSFDVIFVNNFELYGVISLWKVCTQKWLVSKCSKATFMQFKWHLNHSANIGVVV